MRVKLVLAVLTFAILACNTLESPREAALPATSAPLPAGTQLPATIPAPVVPSPSITSLHMLNELDGWAITDSAILRTTDGGTTWYNVSPRGVTTFGFGTGHTFLNASQAWIMVANAGDPAGSGLLYRTSDGGLNWTAYPVPFGGGDLTFLDESHGWMMAALGGAAGSMAVSIYRTDDGGATWTQTFTNDPNLANAGESLPLAGIKNNLTPLNSQTAWVGGVVYAPETFYFYKTSDGGRTWAQQNLPAAPGMQNAEVALDTGPIFLSPSEGILPVRFSGETVRTGFYATHDSGVSWEFVSFMPGAGAVDIVVPDGLFWNGEGFFITFDGARTWKGIQSDLLFTDSFAGMDFVNTRTGWVWTYDQTGQYGLYKTTDGGASWFPLGNR